MDEGEPTDPGSRSFDVSRFRRRLALAAGGPLLLWWLALFPGLFSVDSGDVLQQVRTGAWKNAHTVLYPALVSLTTVGGRWPFLLTLSQVLLVAGALVYLGDCARRAGVDPLTVLLSTGGVALLPLLGGMTATAWKDVPYCAGAILAAGYLWSLAASRTPSRADQLLGCCALISLAGFRWNGFLAAAVVLAAAVALSTRGRRTRTGLVGSTMILVGVMTLVVPAQLGLVQDSTVLGAGLQLKDLAMVARSSPDAFTKDEWGVMRRVMTPEQWRRSGDVCASGDLSLAGLQPFDAAKWRTTLRSLERSNAAIGDIWMRQLSARPMSVLHARLCRAKSALLPVPVDRDLPLALWPYGPPRMDGVAASWRVPVLSDAAGSIVRSSNVDLWLQWTVFRAPPWIVAALLFAACCWRRMDRAVRSGLAAVWVALGIILAATASAGAQDLRYTLPAALLAQYWLCVACLSVLRSYRRGARTDGADRQRVSGELV